MPDHPPSPLPLAQSPGRIFSRPHAWRWILTPALLGIVGFAVVHPFDLDLSHAAARLQQSLGGDIRREWFAWQQFGQGLCLIILALAIWQLDVPRRRRLLDLLLAVGIAQLCSTAGKMLIGRPRPRPEFEDPRTFLWPWGTYPIQVNGQTVHVHAWDTAAGANADLWSMPSSHTLFAAVLAGFLAHLYPPVRWLVVFLVALVGTGRVVFDAHWPTDVIVGAALGWIIVRWIVHGFAGVRLLDVLWRTFVNKNASPALPAVLHHEVTRPFGR